MKKGIATAATAALILAVSCGDEGGGGRLTLTFPASVGEGGSPQGTVTIPKSVDEDIIVSLTSSNPYFLLLPSPVTIPAGQTQVAFTATTPDNDFIDAGQALTLTASHPEYESASLATVVTDNEAKALVVSLPPSPIGEGEASGIGSVTLMGGATARVDLVISLDSSDPTSVTVPDTVTIAPGGFFADFDIQAIEDENAVDEIVAIEASCAAVPSASASISVDDNDD